MIIVIGILLSLIFYVSKQVYEGLVFMDFSQDLMEQQGHGNYSYLKIASKVNFPKLFLAYLTDPSDSGIVIEVIMSVFMPEPEARGIKGSTF